MTSKRNKIAEDSSEPYLKDGAFCEKGAEFYLEKYKSLRQEQIEHSRREFNIQRDYIVFLLGFFTLAEAKLSGEISAWLYLFPVGVGILAMMHQQRYLFFIMTRGEYLRSLENMFSCAANREPPNPDFGWEAFLARARAAEHDKGAHWFLLSTFLPGPRITSNTNIAKYFYILAIISSFTVFVIKLAAGLA